MAEENIKAEEMVVSETVEVTETPETAEKFAKAGKKSKKHVEEVKAEEERKARAAENKLAEKPTQQNLLPLSRSTPVLVLIHVRQIKTSAPLLFCLTVMVRKFV